VPADQRPPRGPVRPPATRRAADPLAAQRRRVERIWSLALRRFRDYLQGTDGDSSKDGVDDNAVQDTGKSDHDRP
jgi:hypothetical protein